MPQHEIDVEENDQGSRLDTYLAKILAERFSRSQIKKMIEEGGVKIEGRIPSAHYRIKTGDKVMMEWGERSEDETRAEDIPLDILFEDEDVIVVNKPAGMVVHPAHGNPHHTLVNALLFHVKGLSSLGGPVRPGIVHRLDKDTSGVMVVAKNDRAHGFLAKQFKRHTIERVYHVLVRGIVQHDETLCEEPVGRAFLNRKKVVIQPSGGKDAFTFFRVLKRFKNATLLEARPKTGRTHQIRVHLTHIGHPVVGDTLYGNPSALIPRQALHAAVLGFVHPTTRERLSFQSPMPADMIELTTRLATE